MTVTSVEKDADTLTMTLVAEFEAPAERVWELWADRAKLERWWGPPGYPATFERHDLSAGGGSSYFMTGPEGERYGGWWRVDAVDPPSSLELTDGFADADGNPNEEMPESRIRVRLSALESGTRMEIRTTFASREEMEKLVEMGMDQGLRQSVGQMDALLG